MDQAGVSQFSSGVTLEENEENERWKNLGEALGDSTVTVSWPNVQIIATKK